MHRNSVDGKKVVCKKVCTDKSLCNEECLLRLKIWLLRGLEVVDADNPVARDQHLAMDIKKLELMDPAEVERLCPPP